MVGREHYHQDAHPDDLQLHSERGWQDNPHRMYEQMQDVHSLQGEEEMSRRQVHPGSQSKKTILTERSITDLDD